MSGTRERGLRLVLASNNPHKAQELARVLPGCRIVTPRELGLDHDPMETGDSFRENALAKALDLLPRVTGRDDVDGVIADDSGLCVNALGGRPGVHSNRYGSEGGPLLSPEAKIQRLLQELVAADDREASFVCALAVARGDDIVFEARGVMEGTLAPEPRGTAGFGYDPIFYVPPCGRTLAEVSPEDKAAVSHRGQAFRALRAWLAGP